MFPPQQFNNPPDLRIDRPSIAIPRMSIRSSCRVDVGMAGTDFQLVHDLVYAVSDVGEDFGEAGDVHGWRAMRAADVI